MQLFNSFYALNVFSLELKTWDYPIHKHNFYELILIAEGNGIHHLNESSFPYAKGDIYLMTPADAHRFEIVDETRFIFVKFNEQLLTEKLDGRKATRWLKIFEQMLHSKSALQSSIIKNQNDTIWASQLFEQLLAEYKAPQKYTREILLELFGALMLIVSRNFSFTAIPNLHEDKLDEILGYIRHHANQAEKLNLKQMASLFSLSPNYLSAFIKKHTGLTPQQHTMKFRMQTADALIKQNRLNINEIAAHLGFNDASHFNKLYKKYRGHSPTKHS